MPDQLHLLFLPAYSPELQPAEHLLVPGPLTNTVLINRHFADLEELEDAQARRCDAASPCSSAGISSARPRAFIGGRSVSKNAKDPGLRDMTPNRTPTRTYVSERRRPLPRACALFGHGSYALTAVSGRKESGSKTAGCRFDSCPTCHENPEFKQPRMNDAQPLLRFQRLIRQLLRQFASD